MVSKNFLESVKDDAAILHKEAEDGKEVWCVKLEDAFKAIEMAREEGKEEIKDNTLYVVKKGDFVTIYNEKEDKHVVGKIDRITKSAFYFLATNSEEKTYSRDNWTLKIEI
jgi:hypothetical protein